MSINFKRFDESSVKILTLLANNFPRPTEISFHDIFPDADAVSEKDKLTTHIGTLAFLRHEDIIAHDVGSVSSFILTNTGLALFNENAFEHLKILLDK
ncbi:hypothetical protein [Colwellia echini]|uniref:Transcriptional regulator n=1 Tax=Colwellia echini TaxID=1982103 RepID=A0ABY3N1K2_9GAMM|nr:hypothetical protein [Colwellia echini]TYK67363.1 hypothetical protein CWS31_002235 [Colwellia echini]